MHRTVTRLYFAISIVVAPLSCKEEVRKELKKSFLPSFNVSIPEINLNIPPIAFVSANEVPVGALSTHINLDSTIKANTAGTFGASTITSVKVKKLVLKLLNATKTNNLSNFESARMRIYSNSDTASVDIANIRFAATYIDSLTVQPENSAEISNYLKGSQLGYNLYWKNRRTTDKFLKLSVRITLSVQ